MHGFDKFFGNLYHLNAEEEPEDPDYPKDPTFKAQFGPRGVIKSKASDRDDPTVDPRFGKVRPASFRSMPMSVVAAVPRRGCIKKKKRRVQRKPGGK